MRYFDDLHVDVELPVGTWHLDVDSVVAFATQWDPQPFHIDPVAARSSIFGRLTASSLHLFAICTRLFFDMEDPVAVMAMVGKDQIRFSHPAAADETLTYTTTVQELRASRSKSDRGIAPRSRPASGRSTGSWHTRRSAQQATSGVGTTSGTGRR